MAEARLSGIRKSFGATEVIRGVDLTIADGSFVVFVGPSGCGKSTLLRMIAGLEDITAGDLFIDGKRCNDMPPKERGIAMVFQSYALYPHKSVFGNMAFGLRMQGVGRDAIGERVRRAAETLEIAHLLERRPSQLSGGQRQRVAIGRAIVREPAIFLFDEPLSNLDAALRVNMRMEIARLHRELKATTVYVTHDQVEAMTLADRIVVLDKGVARQVGSPLDIYHNPADLFVAGFIGSPRMNTIAMKVAGGSDGAPRLESPCIQGIAVPEQLRRSLKLGASVTLGIRPENVALRPPGEGDISGRIEFVERLGPHTQVGLRLSDGALLVAIAGPLDPIRVGDMATVTLASTGLHLFDETGIALPR